uniref:Uncharacterized protein n=1 Tax=Nelumbo nucifera TaxID=4432 RepID=A0A822Z0I0_NELNU|nr:TPA_asm: hypothetical protein HUJ06_014207 [Nelumbo nucifera]
MTNQFLPRQPLLSSMVNHGRRGYAPPSSSSDAPVRVMFECFQSTQPNQSLKGLRQHHFFSSAVYKAPPAGDLLCFLQLIANLSY